MVTIDLSGHTGLVVGVADKHSIAWGIAQILSEAGMRLALTYQNERLERNVRELAATLPDPLLLPLDVTDDGQIDAVFQAIRSEFGRLDCLVHAVAFAPREDLMRDYVDTSRDGFRIALDVSAYSLAALARGARPLMKESGGGSIVTLTYYGAEKVVAGYNVMGVAKAALEASVRYLANDLGPDNIRVNAISAGPMKTLAARGIPGFMSMLKHHEEKAPLRRRVDMRELAGTALFLCSPLATGITGEVIHVDCGYNILGL
ncbi:MAG: enoyl-ACP reductase [Bacillota bacterium]|nr:enoyl-[acyl-carrier-protein] reductase FabI [Bacillota bacterium]REJ34247.1 MAG: NADH-specific enoyl-ACP reductase [Bacillota bacterium]